jgi:hypothetical protein
MKALLMRHIQKCARCARSYSWDGSDYTSRRGRATIQSHDDDFVARTRGGPDFLRMTYTPAGPTHGKKER